MLRLPEGKVPEGLLQAKTGAVGSIKNSNARQMDMEGLLQTTKEGHKHILAICDHFTKHIKIFTMKTQTALEVAEKCLEYCLTFGIPESVLTDQGLRVK